MAELSNLKPHLERRIRFNLPRLMVPWSKPSISCQARACLRIELLEPLVQRKRLVSCLKGFVIAWLALAGAISLNLVGGMNNPMDAQFQSSSSSKAQAGVQTRTPRAQCKVYVYKGQRRNHYRRGLLSLILTRKRRSASSTQSGNATGSHTKVT